MATTDDKAAELDAIAEASEEDAARMAGVRLIAKHRAKIKELKGLLRASEKQVEQLDQLVTAYERAKAVRPKPMKVRHRATKSKPAVVPVVLCSDLHICEIVTLAQTGGANEHNREIGEERAERLFRNAVRLIKDEQKRCDIREIVWWLGGDFLVNELHGVESMRSCMQSPIEEMEVAVGVLRRGFDYLLKRLDVEKILVPTSFANHGRTTPKPLVAQAPRYDLEQAAYRLLAMHYQKAGETRIEFAINENPLSVIPVGKVTLGFHHGHGIRYNGGVGGIAVPMNSAVKAWGQSDVTQADIYNFGHFHQVYSAPKFNVNGSGVGTTAMPSGSRRRSSPLPSSSTCSTWSGARKQRPRRSG